MRPATCRPTKCPGGVRAPRDAGSPDSVLSKNKDQLEQNLVGRQHSETFGSVADYANRNLHAAGNADQGAQQSIMENMKALQAMLDVPAKTLQKAAEMFVDKLNTIPG